MTGTVTLFNEEHAYRFHLARQRQWQYIFSHHRRRAYSKTLWQKTRP